MSDGAVAVASSLCRVTQMKRIKFTIIMHYDEPILEGVLDTLTRDLARHATSVIGARGQATASWGSDGDYAEIEVRR